MSTAEALPLREGLEIRCPRCRHWHRLERSPAGSDHAYAREMLYFTCERNGGRYYAGQAGGTARYPVRTQPR